MMLKSARKYIFCLMKRGIFDHVPDILLACTSTRQVQVEREWRVTRERKSRCFSPRVCIVFASTRLEKVRKTTRSTNYLSETECSFLTVFMCYMVDCFIYSVTLWCFHKHLQDSNSSI